MKDKLNIRPDSFAWLSENDKSIAYYFESLGFDNLKQILDMRVFDLMNMNGLNAIRVDEILRCLYLWLNPNPEIDKAMYIKALSQPFSYSAWRKVHRNLSDVTVGELVMTPDINLRALQHFYDAVRKAFFKSDEYTMREYRYRNRHEYQMHIRKRKEVN